MQNRLMSAVGVECIENTIIGELLRPVVECFCRPNLRYLGQKCIETTLIMRIAVLFMLSPSLHAAGGVLWGEKDISVISTEHFDIIFPARSADAAEHLSMNAESIYADVCDMLGVEEILRNVRYPVTLAPAREVHNAFYTQFFANHIVMYDTPAPRNNVTSSDTFLETFRHELTHAVTCNMKNAFWRGMTRIFGDGAVLGAAILTKSHLEGIAVVSESADGQGRLNDPYSFFAVRQAKIEGCFPHYADVYGARDAYPADVYYSFGASFDDYLRLKYGMQKYAAFWYKCINLKTIHQSFVFKSVFGITMKDAWQDFYDSIKVPDINGDPCVTGNVSLWPRVNNALGARYDCVSRDDAGNILYCDKRTGAVYLYAPGVSTSQGEYQGEYQESKGKTRHLFTVANNALLGAKLSLDGRFAAVNTICTAHVSHKTEVRIFDIEHHRWHRLPGTGLREGAVIKAGGKDYACAVRTSSLNQELVLWELEEKERFIFDGLKTAEDISIPLPPDVSIYDLTDGGDGEIACIMQRDNNCSFLFIDTATRAMREVPLPSGIKARDIAMFCSPNLFSLGQNLGANRTMHQEVVEDGVEDCDGETMEYTFSYANKDILPRLGILKMSNEGAEYLWPQTVDVSGAVYCPVRLNDGNVLYIGQFFQDSRLLMMTVPKTNAESTSVNIAQAAITSDSAGRSETVARDEDSEALVDTPKPKSLFPVPIGALRGMWLPVSAAFLYNSDGDRYKWLPFGATAATASPWFSGTGCAVLTAGYYDGNAAAEILVNGGTDSQVFRYTLDAQAALDTDNMKFYQTMTSLKLTSVLPTGMTSRLFLNNSTQFLFDKETLNANVWFKTPLRYTIVKTKADMDYTYVTNWTSVLWSNIHQIGESTLEQCGVGLGVFVNMEYKKYDYKIQDTATIDFLENRITQSDWTSNPGFEVKAALPRLLPFRATSRITANLPITAEAMLFPNSDKLFMHTETMTLFGYEVQKAIPFASIAYINRIALECRYTGKFFYTDGSHSWAVADAYELIKDAFNGNMGYRDKLCFLAALTATPNYGATVALHLTLRGGLGLHLNRNPGEDCAEGLLTLLLNY